MAKMITVESDSAYANSVIPQGKILSFMSMQDGAVVQRAKLADGSFVNLSSGGASLRAGYGNVLGGLGVLISSYESDSTTVTLSLDDNSDSNFDWSLFQAGT